ncbi:multi antimicrobial extrusion protein MatE [Paenibacillus athensensis]|uniref:Multi antimicrobial extrusion protein MatE n=1 Tax=Paenibacillus athensensis TaxID=1967502 RepID=A0A4Y8QA81_9BACL|nr:multi antimicrobial extrusion protein MatE [Paenibacillus athensensis]
MNADAPLSPVTWKRLISFFVPLGLSATLVTLSHVIINGTLARAERPELIISSYALALSLQGITERPALLLRQTCSTLVRDRLSFLSMSRLAAVVIAGILLLGVLINYTALGEWIFVYGFGVEPDQLAATIGVYRIMMFVSLFSGIRCLFHGIIISNMRTKWLTIGMGVRLAVMYLLALYFIASGPIESGRVGAVIFLAGMAIEAAVSVWEGRSLLRTVIPRRMPDHPVEKPGHILKFYKPLLYSSFIAVFIGPSINAMLGKSADIHLAIASYAIAGSLSQLVMSFFSYTHQIVLNFYRKDPRAVRRFTLSISLLPGLLIAIMAYTAVGPWLMTHVMGVSDRLMEASLDALRVLMIVTLVFPQLDFANGLIMLRGQTKIMVWSQGANVVLTLLTLVLCIWLTPGWNGAIGALAQSLGMLAELGVVLYVLRITERDQGQAVGPFYFFTGKRVENHHENV